LHIPGICIKRTTYTGSRETCGYQYIFVFTVVLSMLCN